MHVVDPPGANDATGHDTADRPGNGSATPTEVSVTFPVLVTTNEYATASPAAATVVGAARLHDRDRRRLRHGHQRRIVVDHGCTDRRRAGRGRRVHDRTRIHIRLRHRIRRSTRRRPTRRQRRHRTRHRRQPRQRIGDTHRGERDVARVRHHERVRHNITSCRDRGRRRRTSRPRSTATASPSRAPNRHRSPPHPTGGVPDAVAVFTTEPASTSACVTRYEAVHVVDAPGANDATGHVTADRPGNGSATPTEVSVTFPVFVTTNEYATASPAAATVDGTAVFTTEIDGSGTTVTVATSVSEHRSADRRRTGGRGGVDDRPSVDIGLGDDVRGRARRRRTRRQRRRPDTTPPTGPATDRRRRPR